MTKGHAVKEGEIHLNASDGIGWKGIVFLVSTRADGSESWELLYCSMTCSSKQSFHLSQTESHSRLVALMELSPSVDERTLKGRLSLYGD